MKRTQIILLACLICVSALSCSDDKDPAINNDYIKRTVSPLLVGEPVQFIYAMGTPEGKIKTAYATASMPGAPGTGFETHKWYTDSGGTDLSEPAATDCRTDGALSSAQVIDDNAVTLRYNYVVPEEIRGKEVRIEFSCETTTGSRNSVRTGTYRISKMDMRKNITLKGDDAGERYFSIGDMKAYTRDEVQAGGLSERIDFIYGYAPSKTVGINSYSYRHAFFSPAATGYYPDGFSLAEAWTKNSTPMEKKLYIWDGQLKDDVNNNIYVDDLDMQAQTFDNAADYILDLRAEGSAFMRTADGKYVAYIYINSLDDATATAVVGIKRYEY